MDSDFLQYLDSNNITEGTQQVLREELINTRTLFGSLEKQHFDKLLPKLKVGQHALLLQLWTTELSERKVRSVKCHHTFKLLITSFGQFTCYR